MNKNYKGGRNNGMELDIYIYDLNWKEDNKGGRWCAAPP